ncbi:hypothetical protein E2C01_075250 [Portunus trituberculatus]|uniref:Secreted protein n=1 Tax=Portunus trituberculatus TaxID=210409 RepID=A0A5B7IJK8_PORTR|nr:hypothetical protein [Portunus trituberculatus]
MCGSTYVALRVLLLWGLASSFVEHQHVCGTTTPISPPSVLVSLPCVGHQQVCGTAMYGAPPGVQSHPGVIPLSGLRASSRLLVAQVRGSARCAALSAVSVMV